MFSLLITILSYYLLHVKYCFRQTISFFPLSIQCEYSQWSHIKVFEEKNKSNSSK